MQTPRPLRKAFVLLAPLLLAAPLAAAPPQDRVTGGGQEVQVTVSQHSGSATTVCLETAPAVTGRKTAQVWYRGGSASLAPRPGGRGPDCASFTAGDGEVAVRLEYVRLMVFPARLPVRTFPAASVRGKRITFRWVRE